MTLTKQVSTVLAKVDDFHLADFDFIGQKYPNVSPGHKTIFYLLIAAASLPAQSAWAAMSLIIVPVGVSVASATMGISMLLKSAAADEDEDVGTVDVEAQEVGEQTMLTAVETTAEPVYEPNPFTSPNLGKRREYYEGEVYASPEEKAAATVDSVSAIVEATPTAITATPCKRPMDIAKYMAMNLKPTLISAVPRTGKGVAIAQMWREFKTLHPNGIVWVIQPKPAATELGYWEGVDKFWGEMIEDALGDASEIARISKELSEFVKTWRQQPQRPKMLIIDEAVKIQSVLKRWYSDFLVPTIQVEASSGETDERYLYVVSQSPLVKDIGISTGNRSSLQFLHLQKPGEDENLSMVMGTYKSIPEPEDELYDLSESPKQAIFYHTAIGEWYPAPAYPVYQQTLVTVGAPAREPEPVYPQKSVWNFDRKPQLPSWEFDEEEATATPVLDDRISEFRQYASEPRYQCVIEFLESLKEHSNGTQLSPSDFGKSKWASRWNGKDGGIKDRSGASVSVFLKNAVKLGFLAPADDKYEVTLK